MSRRRNPAIINLLSESVHIPAQVVASFKVTDGMGQTGYHPFRDLPRYCTLLDGILYHPFLGTWHITRQHLLLISDSSVFTSPLFTKFLQTFLRRLVFKGSFVFALSVAVFTRSFSFSLFSVSLTPFFLRLSVLKLQGK